MHLTDAPTTMPDLSCYTTNLLAYLTPHVPDVRRRLAHAVRLAVRTDLPPGELAFSHHTRIDTTDDGRRLAYHAALDWPTARRALLGLLHRDRRALAVANTRHLPWAPAHQQADAPHWLLIRDHRDGRWLLADHFSALTPHGEQKAYLGWVDDTRLAALMTPWPHPSREAARRDGLALGETVPLPPPAHYRWLAPTTPAPAPDAGAPGPGTWTFALEPSLTHVAAVLREDPTALTRHADDLWAAARHHTYRLAYALADAALDPERAAAATVAWDALPQALRFAARSAARGRPRPGLVDRAVNHLLTAHHALRADLPEKD
ncbi:hypothetical protein [Streptomyces ossamyceticus]|uniref:Uncharacterized protein n=1 Tax=Streptomyces ossamyceticus TaxID=249581 RepID=A0ABV2UWN4_9ACTN